MAEFKLADGAERLFFLYGKFPDVPKSSMAYWLSVQEFVNKMNSIVDNNGAIDKSVLFELMDTIYRSKDTPQKNCKDFNFRLAKRAINKLQ